MDILVILTIVIIVAGFIALFVLWQKLKQKEKKIQRIESRLHRHTVKTMEQVHQNSEQILQESLKKASKIIKDTKSVKEDNEKLLEEVLQQAAKQHVNILEQQLNEISENFGEEFENLEKLYEKQAKKTLNQMESTGKVGLQKLEKVLDKQTVSLENYLKVKVDAEFEKARAEVAKYKAAEMAKVQDSIHEIVKKTVASVIGKSIPMSEHEKLIISALDEAKNEGMFDNE